MFVLSWFILKHCKTGTDLAFIIEGGSTTPSKRRSQGFKRKRALTRRILIILSIDFLWLTSQ